MVRRAHGVIRHNTVILDEPLPEMEGRRVEVDLRDESGDEAAPSNEELRRAWAEWVDRSREGPIEGEPDGWPGDDPAR
jgi:hypothetical protein